MGLRSFIFAGQFSRTIKSKNGCRIRDSVVTTQLHLYRTLSWGQLAAKSYYEILGVSKTATEAEIKNAYYNLAKKMHPDINKSDLENERNFADINLAYQTLKNPEKRRLYDMKGEQGVADEEFDLMETIEENGLESIFDARKMSKSSLNVVVDLKVLVEHIVGGGEIFIAFHRLGACSECEGTGSSTKSAYKTCVKCDGKGVIDMNEDVHLKCSACDGVGTMVDDPCSTCHSLGVTREAVRMKVSIPAGLANGSYIMIRGWGDQGMRNGDKGDLYLKVQVISEYPHTIIGEEVHMDVPITTLQAALGDVVSVKTLGGEQINVRIPPGTQPEDVMELKNAGIPSLAHSSEHSGSQFLHWVVNSPKITDPELVNKVKSIRDSIRPIANQKYIQYKD